MSLIIERNSSLNVTQIEDEKRLEPLLPAGAAWSPAAWPSYTEPAERRPLQEGALVQIYLGKLNCCYLIFSSWLSGSSTVLIILVRNTIGPYF